MVGRRNQKSHDRIYEANCRMRIPGTVGSSQSFVRNAVQLAAKAARFSTLSGESYPCLQVTIFTISRTSSAVGVPKIIIGIKGAAASTARCRVSLFVIGAIAICSMI